MHAPIEFDAEPDTPGVSFAYQQAWRTTFLTVLAESDPRYNVTARLLHHDACCYVHGLRDVVSRAMVHPSAFAASWTTLQVLAPSHRDALSPYRHAVQTAVDRLVSLTLLDHPEHGRMLRANVTFSRFTALRPGDEWPELTPSHTALVGASWHALRADPEKALSYLVTQAMTHALRGLGDTAEERHHRLYDASFPRELLGPISEHLSVMLYHVWGGASLAERVMGMYRTLLVDEATP